MKIYLPFLIDSLLVIIDIILFIISIKYLIIWLAIIALILALIILILAIYHIIQRDDEDFYKFFSEKDLNQKNYLLLQRKKKLSRR